MRRLSFAALPVSVFLSLASGLAGQTPATPAAPAPQLNFSGVLYGNFQYRTDKAARATNKFDVERAYLNFRMPAGERTSIRITTDVYQQQTAPADAYYRGWTVRLKYAFIQQDFWKGKEASAFARVGLLNTVVIEHIEGFWPRWMASTSLERAGYFSAADMGVSAQLNLPHKWGEALAVIANGPGYTSRELDRFKDYSARVTFTPMSSATSPLVRSLALSLWDYKGAIASRFVAGGPGQVGPVNQALQRDRYGAFAGIRDPRLTLAVDISRRADEGETGNNTTVSPRAVVDSTGSVNSVFAIVHPFHIRNGASTVPFGVIARRDMVKPNGRTDPNYTFTILGLLWDLSKKTTVALDYQVQSPKKGASVPEVKTVFAHFVASF